MAKNTNRSEVCSDEPSAPTHLEKMENLLRDLNVELEISLSSFSNHLDGVFGRMSEPVGEDEFVDAVREPGKVEDVYAQISRMKDNIQWAIREFKLASSL